MLKDIFVGCMPFGFTEQDIRTQFMPYGSVVSVKLWQDLEHATFDAFAHVAIETDDVEHLLRELDGKRIGSRLLRVNEVVCRTEPAIEREAPARKAKAPAADPLCIVKGVEV